jgi:hypothetical protein
LRRLGDATVAEVAEIADRWRDPAELPTRVTRAATCKSSKRAAARLNPQRALERFPIFCVQFSAKTQDYWTGAVRLDSHFPSIRFVTLGGESLCFTVVPPLPLYRATYEPSKMNLND